MQINVQKIAKKLALGITNSTLIAVVSMKALLVKNNIPYIFCFHYLIWMEE